MDIVKEKKIIEFYENNNIPYHYIWYFIKNDTKTPINEYNKAEILDINNTLKKQKKTNYEITIPISYKVNKKNINLTEEDKESLKLCLSGFVKHTQNIYVIDIDDETIKLPTDLPQQFNILYNSIFIKGNTKGIHIYVKINGLDEYSCQQDVLKHLKGDLIRQNNIWERCDKSFIYGNDFNIIELEWNDIKDWFDLIKMNFKNNINDDNTIKTTDLYNLQSNINQKEENDNSSIFSSLTDADNKNKIDLLQFRKYIDDLSVERSDNYNYWTKVIWGIYNTSKENKWSATTRNQIIHTFSKKSSKYDESFVDEFIQNNIKDDKEGIGVGTIINYYKEDNPNEIIGKIDIDMSERGMALLFIKFNKDIIIYQNGNLFIYFKNEWKEDIETLISKNVISEFLINFILKEKIKLDKELNMHLKENIDEKKVKKEIDEIIIFIKKLKNIKLIGEILKQIISIYASNNDNIINFNLDNNQKYNIHFKNGVYDIKNKLFRNRVKEDYTTIFLDYNYIEYNKIDKTKHEFIESFFKKIQPKDIQRNFTLSYLAYSITGNTGKQIFKVNIGYSASNGKSTEIKIHEKTFPIYTTKLNKDTFNKGNIKRHKYIAKCLHSPIRLAYIEELDSQQLDADFLKDWVDGNRISNEIMYSTCEELPIQSKLLTFSNKDFNIKGDEGIYRRGKVQFYESKFTDKIEKDDFDKNMYKKVDNFENIFEDDEYKNAYFHLLLNYIDKLEIPCDAEKNFKAIVDEKDDLKNEIDNLFIITKNKNDIMSKYEIIDLLSGYQWNNILSKLKSMEISFECSLRFSDEKSIYKGKRGILYGIQKI